jgi:hypothetical protein
MDIRFKAKLSRVGGYSYAVIVPMAIAKNMMEEGKEYQWNVSEPQRA